MTLTCFLSRATARSTPITPLTPAALKAWLKKQPRATQGWVEASGFAAAPNVLLALPGPDGAIARILFGVDDKDNGPYAFADLPFRLPKNDAGYFIDKKMTARAATDAALGWALGCYRYDRYASKKKPAPVALVWPDKADKKFVEAATEAVFLVRDLINTPANDLGPEELAAAAKKLAARFGATFKAITGTDLLKQNYPAIHAVGKGSPRAPRLIDLRWGNPKNPMITLVGKGVCFDTGGLDLKPGSAMALMKKDMGGAAHALGLAQMIMARKLPVRLRALIPAVENSTDGHSYRPGDILQTRKGITVEVGDTDAEGRLVLADALAEAAAEKPSLIIDFATLTGAARVALGPELPALFCNDEKTASALLRAAAECADPMWRLPLWQPYAALLNSKTADTNNISAGGMAGAITAALFMEKFVEKGVPWVHIDTFAWNSSSKPGRPEGGEALGLRACYDLICSRAGARRR